MKEKPAYTIREVAELMGFSRQTVSRLFEKEPGVLVLGHPERLHKRGYRCVRIPHHIYARVVARISIR